MNVRGKKYLNIKTDPENSELLRNTYEYIVPGYHMNKQHWNTVILSEKCDKELVEELIEQSYDLTKKYEPNITHNKLTELERKGKLKAIITQNIDGLHQKANSKNVLELHGSVLRTYCMKCHKFYNAEKVFESRGIPLCDCGGIIKPDVVLYEESLDDEPINKSIEVIQKADLMIVAGTSLTVNPARSLVTCSRGNNLVLINRDSTPYDRQANLIINENLGNVFKEI